MVAQRGTGDVGFLAGFGDNGVTCILLTSRADVRIGVPIFTYYDYGVLTMPTYVAGVTIV